MNVSNQYPTNVLIAEDDDDSGNDGEGGGSAEAW